MAILIRSSLTALLCFDLIGCAALMPAIVVPQLAATLGVVGVSAVACATDPLCDARSSPCVDSAGNNIEVTESSEVAVPADEGKVTAFMPAYWQSQFVAERVPPTERSVEEAAGMFVVTDKSARFVPSPGLDGVHIPLAGVLRVDTQSSPTTGAPRQITVESCFGRLDRITFGLRQQPDRLDSEATRAAAAEIRIRVAATRAAAIKERSGTP